MEGETDLQRLLSTLRPNLSDASYVFTTVESVPSGLDPVAMIREDEGITLVVERSDADRLELGYEYVAARITLQVHSALHAVGLTAAVSQALAEHGISCNVIAGYHHDHLFVPVERGEQAVDVLRGLGAARTSVEGKGLAKKWSQD